MKKGFWIINWFSPPKANGSLQSLPFSFASSEITPKQKEEKIHVISKILPKSCGLSNFPPKQLQKL